MGEKKTKEVILKEINATLSSISGEYINVAHALYLLINQGNTEDQPELLRYTCEHYGAMPTNGELEIDTHITENETRIYVEKFGGLIDEMFEFILSENSAPEKFYEDLRDLIHNPFFRDDKIRSFVFHWILIDPRTPYFQLEKGMKMSPEDWNGYNQKLLPRIAKMRFILETKFEQPTEAPDLALREIQTCDEIEKVVLLGFMIDYLKAKGKGDDE